MGLFRNIALTVGLILAVVCRVYPSVADTVSFSHPAMQTAAIKDSHKVNLSSDSAVYFIQDENEEHASSPDANFLTSQPIHWQADPAVQQSTRQSLLIPVGKRAGPHQPYYLLFCSLRIPSI